MQISCKCQRPPFYFTDYDTVENGEDARGAEVSLSTCKRCGAVWLTYLIEEPQYSRSGRWWRVQVVPECMAEVSVASARAYIERQPHGFAGGRFFNSSGHPIVGPIHVA